ncbi:MAG: DUF4956 domain-containing protein [Gemmatimonadales bacterium]
MQQAAGGRFAKLSENPVVRVLAYYVLLAAGTALVWQVFPGLHTVFSAERLDALSRGRDVIVDPVFESLTGGGEHLPAPVALAITTALCMAGAFVLMLPVAWVYILTRQKKGYRQSLVQTLVILPIVVAGVVLLVKNSVALAFSLGGIVAAVSFRNTLRDTKDAVCIFLATAVGLAAGVQVMSAAAMMSFLFNVVILVFWYTDFGRAPAHLEGPGAARRLQRSRALANRSGAFVSLLDRDILRSMTPEQLEAIAIRAQRRAERPQGTDSKVRKPLATAVTVQTGNQESAQPVIESLLAAQVKEWKLSGVTRDSGGLSTLEYRVRLRKSVSAGALAQALRTRLGSQATNVEAR